ncbi:gliding motility lipoprotein GldH [Thermophagus sp. OGC60D27]|uniref:gliding motility lipoprotein GldH n=1 Tax=Thermophagus sp. OGC60D27 TaxID=3458415 RepID=UPI004037B42D
MAAKVSWLWKLTFLVFVVGACQNSTLYEQGSDFYAQSWDKDSTLVFKPVINDTSQVLNVGFSLVHTNDYPYSNMWLFIEVEGPDGTMQTDTMEYFLAEPTGQWIGRGNDNRKTLYWIYRRDVKLTSPGQYRFSVTQGMRRETLPGVGSFSLWIEKAAKPKVNSD